ncbi:hypothetical protein HOP51_03845 [Halomonas sp. MCCC 1A11036]|uniref:Uncharacterized protein n=1 Tax=Billgrantia zhangzhouensis TaxID=2733481 RepID=A0ABS9ABK1_9GAMM|nr:hypothetical protein [Halomonas zhangzhouensis]MCE8019254.1 hypothetical protein [Halomonas zhangzhouensis]
MLMPCPEREVIVVSPLLLELIQAFSELPVRYDDAGTDGRLVGVLLDRLAVADQAGLMLPWPEDPRLGDICRQLQVEPADRSQSRATLAG